MVGDEIYHFPLARSFASSFPVFSDSYSSAYTPLPYLVIGLLMKFLGTGLSVARLFNLATGLIGIVGFAKLSKVISPKNLAWPTSFFAFYPYYLRNSSTFYMGNYALVLSIWALIFYLRRGKTRNALLASMLLGAATLSGQWALAVVGGVVLNELLQLFENGWKFNKKNLGKAASTGGLIILFQIPALLLFIGWKGLTHPKFSTYALTVSAEHITGMLAVLGFTFAFWALGQCRNIAPSSLAFLIALLPLFLISLPEISVYQGEFRFAGLTVRILAGISSYLGFGKPVLLAPASLLGLILLYRAWQISMHELLVLKYAILLLLVSYAGSRLLGETHLAIVMPLIFLLIWQAKGMDPLMRLVVAQNTALGLAYAFYHALFKFT